MNSFKKTLFLTIIAAVTANSLIFAADDGSLSRLVDDDTKKYATAKHLGYNASSTALARAQRRDNHYRSFAAKDTRASASPYGPEEPSPYGPQGSNSQARYDAGDTHRHATIAKPQDTLHATAQPLQPKGDSVREQERQDRLQTHVTRPELTDPLIKFQGIKEAIYRSSNERKHDRNNLLTLIDLLESNLSNMNKTELQSALNELPSILESIKIISKKMIYSRDESFHLNSKLSKLKRVLKNKIDVAENMQRMAELLKSKMKQSPPTHDQIQQYKKVANMIADDIGEERFQ